MVGGRNHRPVQFRRAILCAGAIAPGADGSAKVREGGCQGRNFRLAGRAFPGVPAFFKTDVTDEIHGNSLLREVLVHEVLLHLVPSSLARTDWSARKRWV